MLRATSHTRLKAHGHCNLRVLIGQKGGDRPSSLHTRRWRPKGPKKTSWMKSLHGVLHGGLWIRYYGHLGFLVGPPPRGESNANSGRPCFLLFFQTWQILWQIPWQTNTTKQLSQIKREFETCYIKTNPPSFFRQQNMQRSCNMVHSHFTLYSRACDYI